MALTKETSAPKKPAPTSSSPAPVPATAFPCRGNATATMTASTSKTKKIARQSRAWRHSSSATTFDSASRNRTNVTAFRTAMMAAMSSGVRKCSQISATLRSTSSASQAAFVFQLHGAVTAQRIAMINRMKRIVARLRAPTISTSAIITSAFSRRTFAMEKTTVAMQVTKDKSTRARDLQSSVRMVNGRALV